MILPQADFHDTLHLCHAAVMLNSTALANQHARSIKIRLDIVNDQ